MNSFTAKVATYIDDSRDFSVIGLSFGGMVAVELTRLLKPRHTILISSVSCSSEIPPMLKRSGRLHLDKLLPARAIPVLFPLANWFGGITSPEDRKILKAGIRDSDPHYMKWAIHEVLNWQRKDRPDNIFHIHGDADRTFPIEYVKADRVIHGGGHFMILTHADEVSSILRQQLGD